MLSPNKICTNCAPVFFEYYQKNLQTQAELLRMRDEVQRLSFTRDLSTLKDASEVELSISPQMKYQGNSKFSENKTFVLNLTQKESARVDKQASLATTATIIKSFTPSGKYASKATVRDYPLQKRPKEALTNISTVLQPAIGIISPLERLKDFENQVNRKVDSFKKKLKEAVERSSKRKTYSRVLSARPKTTVKVLKTMGDEEKESKSVPKVSMFSPGEDVRSPRASPIEFRLTPKLEKKEKTEKGSGPSRGEWTVGTMKEPRLTTLNTDRVLTTENNDLGSSIKRIKDTFKKDLEVVRMKSREISSPGPQDRNIIESPFFSPLRASELTSPRGHHHHHLRTDESKKNYHLFIKPQSTPLIDSLTSSPNGNIAKSEMPRHHIGNLWGDNSTDKKSSYKNNYYKELFSEPLNESPALKTDLMKAEKEFKLNTGKKSDLSQDGLELIHEPPKNFRSPSFNISGKEINTSFSQNQGKCVTTEVNDFNNVLPKSKTYEKTTKKNYDPVHPPEASTTTKNQNPTWFLPVNVREGKFYSVDNNKLKFSIGESTAKPIINGNPCLEGGILIYNNSNDALKDSFLSVKKFDSTQKILLEVKAHGPHMKIDQNTYLYSTITPIKAIYNDFDI